MAGEADGASGKQLDQTPTWAVAGVCAVIIIISILIEKFLHKIGTWCTKRHKIALFEALQKVKAELMILGFISLLLTFGQNYILKICIPSNLANTMLPCSAVEKHDEEKDKGPEHHRRLLSYEYQRRFLAADSVSVKCEELHILIFFLAVIHVLYSAATMMLGKLKIRGWKTWKQQILSRENEFATDPSRFRLTHETSFVKAHTSSRTRILIFFYISLYAAASPILWASFVIFLLINVNGWQVLFWASVIPVIIILAIGTKLQAILTNMAVEITDRHAVVQGIPLVQGSDKYFWFGRPQLLLHLIHFALSQNAFQITYSLWIWYSFGWGSCFQDNVKPAIALVGLGVFVLFICSYITLPLYALVTQMGSRMKKSIFDEQTSKALINWHNAAKRKRGKGDKPPNQTSGGSAADSRVMATGHSTREDRETSNLEVEPLSAERNVTVTVDHGNEQSQPGRLQC